MIVAVTIYIMYSPLVSICEPQRKLVILPVIVLTHECLICYLVIYSLKSVSVIMH